jgi:uncharacterized membrane protein (UPF0127 family)
VINYATKTLDQARGFMGRDSIALDEAMLFTNISPNAQFHMRTVGMQLGIAALDENMRVIDATVMEPDVGGWTTPSGTAHVLEMHPDIAAKLEQGAEPDWNGLFGDDLNIPQKKVSASRNMKLSELFRELRIEISPVSEESLSILQDMIGDECDFDSVTDDKSEIAFKEKGSQIAAEDAEYYGEPVLSDDLGPLSMAEMVVEALWTGASRLKDRKLYVKLASLNLAGSKDKLIANVHHAKLRSNQ